MFAQLTADERKDESDEWQHLPAGCTSASALSAVLLAVNSAALEGVMDALLWQLAHYVDRDTHSQQRAGQLLYALLAPAMLPSSTAPPSSVMESPNGSLVRFLLTNKLLVSRPVSHTASAPHLLVPLSPLVSASLLRRTLYTEHSSVRRDADGSGSTVVVRLLPASRHTWPAALSHLRSPPRLLPSSTTTSTPICCTPQPSYRTHMAAAASAASDESQWLGPFSSHSALLATMEGVQLRMSEMDEKRRREGMRVAVEMSRVMDPTHVLNFDGEDEDDREEKEEEERQLKADEERRQRHDQHKQQALTTASAATNPSTTRPLPVYDLSEHSSDPAQGATASLPV